MGRPIAHVLELEAVPGSVTILLARVRLGATRPGGPLAHALELDTLGDDPVSASVASCRQTSRSPSLWRTSWNVILGSESLFAPTFFFELTTAAVKLSTQKVPQDVVAGLKCDLVAFVLQTCVWTRIAQCSHVEEPQTVAPGLVRATVVVGNAHLEPEEAVAAAVPADDGEAGAVVLAFLFPPRHLFDRRMILEGFHELFDVDWLVQVKPGVSM